MLRSDSCGKVLGDLLGHSPVYANLGVVAAEGSVLCSAAPLPNGGGLAKPEWFQKAGIAGSLAVGFDYKGILSRQASINLGLALPEGRGRKGDILFAVMDLAWLDSLAARSQLPPGSALSVTNRQGDAVVRYPDPDKWVGKPYPQALLQEARLVEGEGVRIAKGIDGVERLYAFSAVMGTGDFVVQIGIRREEVYAPANRILYRQLAALGVVACFALLMAWFGADVFLLKQVNALIGATRRLAAGDLTARSALSYDRGELGDLARAFDDMAEKLEWREAQLRESETERADSLQQLPELLELIPQAALLLDESRRIEAVNRKAGELFGCAHEELAGRFFRDLVPDAMATAGASRTGGGTAPETRSVAGTCERPDGARLSLEILYSETRWNRRNVALVLVRERPAVLAGNGI
jgi:PAS domain S-box-containing protein